MMTFAEICLLAALHSPAVDSFDVSAMPSVPAATVVVNASGLAAVLPMAVLPQGPNRPTPGRRNPPPSGGTPEPMTMLLLAGGALTYGALRLRGRKNVVKES